MLEKKNKVIVRNEKVVQEDRYGIFSGDEVVRQELCLFEYGFVFLVCVNELLY